MKNLTFLTFLFLFTLNLSAQPVLTQSMNFSLGDMYKIDTYQEVSVVDPGNAGANVVWDFSQITGEVIEGIDVICVDPGSTPFADSTAVASAHVCVRSADYPNQGAFSFYNTGTESEQYIAMGFMGEGNRSFTTYSNSQTAMEFPFTYGQVFTDTYELIGYHIDLGYHFMKDSVSVEVVADAYGSIKTAYGTFQNVLRVKRTSTEYFWYRYAQGEDWSFNGIFVRTEYDWYDPNIKAPLFSIVEEEGIPGNMVKYLASYSSPSSIIVPRVEKLRLYPNPADDVVYIDNLTSSTWVQYDIYSLSGALLQTGDVLNHSINIELLKPGKYVIKLHASSSTICKKLIII